MRRSRAAIGLGLAATFASGPASASNAAFALALHETVSRSAGDSNVFLSPWSVSTALAMLMNGAGGGTLEAMRTALRTGDVDMDAVNRDVAASRSALSGAAGEGELETAASAWIRPGIELRPAFLEAARTAHSAEIATLDFTDPAAAERVNEWVSGATHGRIAVIVERLDPATVLVLATAIYFKAPWQRSFARDETVEGDFRASGGAVRAAFMHASGRWSYAEDERAQWIALPYAGGRTEMVVLLPREGMTLDSLMAGIDAADWDRRVAAMTPATGRVTLPRFRLEESLGLVEPLRALGMGVAFDHGRADFSRLLVSPESAPGLAIDDVRHRTRVEVNEEGTEAAGATSVSVTVTSAPAVPPFAFTADRPFFFAIREVSSGTLLFTGSLYRPST